MTKRKAVWISLLLGVAVFLPIDYFTGWDQWFPFVHPFNLLLVTAWSAVLYLALRGGLRTPRRCALWAAIVFALSLPQALFCVLVYSAWVCVAVSAVVVTLLIARALRLRKKSI